MARAVDLTRLGTTGLEVFPLCLGGNVFGWTIDEAQSFEVLDAYADAGGNFIDTADVYSAWAAGNRGGESETIIGRWMAARGNREEMIIATKVGTLQGTEGLSASSIRKGVQTSLRRLGLDRIDLYYAHFDDLGTEQLETIRAFDALVSEGKVRHVGASNFTSERLAAALALSRREGLTEYVALQTHYNLVHRADYEGPLAHLCAEHGLACMPYWALASGFLSGKYRRGDALQGPRAEEVRPYLNERGFGVLEALYAVARPRGAAVGAVALSWLMTQPTVVAPVVSATSPAQLSELLGSLGLMLTADELARLNAASL